MSMFMHYLNVLKGLMLREDFIHMHTYALSIDEGRIEQIVTFSIDNTTITCSYKLFQAKGLLCQYSLYILTIRMNFSSLLSQYILKRWTNDAKQGNGDFCLVSHHKTGAKLSKTIRFNRLMHRSFNSMNMCTDNAEIEEMAHQYLDQLEGKIRSHILQL